VGLSGTGGCERALVRRERGVRRQRDVCVLQGLPPPLTHTTFPSLAPLLPTFSIPLTHSLSHTHMHMHVQNLSFYFVSIS
jgi:hypothetical protein